MARLVAGVRRPSLLLVGTQEAVVAGSVYFLLRARIGSTCIIAKQAAAVRRRVARWMLVARFVAEGRECPVSGRHKRDLVVAKPGS